MTLPSRHPRKRSPEDHGSARAGRPGADGLRQKARLPFRVLQQGHQTGARRACRTMDLWRHRAQLAPAPSAQHSWLEPGEEKRFTQYFLPYAAIGVVKKASRDAALALDVSEDHAQVGVRSTSARPYRIRLSARQGAGGRPGHDGEDRSRAAVYRECAPGSRNRRGGADAFGGLHRR